MPTAFNVVKGFDVDLKLSTGHSIKLISGQNELLFKGNKGKIRVNRGQLTGKPVEDLEADPKANEKIEKRMAELYGDSLEKAARDRGHIWNFFDCIKSGKQPVANVFDHVRAVNACHFATISLLLNRKIQWDVKAKKFKGDDEANVLCSRKQRAPYEIKG
jgi:myo-inositol 2-dehydrogenase / D-chiro-inositol 1-dehydrogenase